MFRLQKNKGNPEGLPFTLLDYYEKNKGNPEGLPLMH